MPIMEYKPEFDIIDADFSGLGDAKIGQKIKVVVNYEAIEKTKRYVILRVLGVMNIKTKRVL